jgi:purine-binding chemotaxis protein CheW
MNVSASKSQDHSIEKLAQNTGGAQKPAEFLSSPAACSRALYASKLTHVSTFRVGNLTLGIDVLRVQEVIRSQQMTQVPLAPKVVKGLINLRGQIVPAIDMRERLGMEGSLEIVPMNVIVRTDEAAVSLIVDDIGDVLEVDSANIEGVPETMSPEIAGMVQSIYKLKTGLLLLLDVDKAIDLAGADAQKPA